MSRVAGSANQVRIIAGQWRSRRVRFLDAVGLRPTPDRVRETLFNWLQHDIAGSHCLDAFAGSGALSLEALSRGAASAVLIERHAGQAGCLLEESRKLGASNCRVLTGDTLALLKDPARMGCPAEGFDLVFVDPPYGQGLVAPVIRLLIDTNSLRPGAWVYLESEVEPAAPDLPDTFVIHRRTRAGAVHACLARYEPTSAPAV